MSETKLMDAILEAVRSNPPMDLHSLCVTAATKTGLSTGAVEWELRTMLEYRYIQKDADGNIAEVTK